MPASRLSPLGHETVQIIATSRADVSYRTAKQKELTRDIKRTQHLLNDSKRLLKAIDNALHRVNAAWRA
jgi:hypothetical protein